ncbi:MAG: ATP synthase F1 subunit delta [Alphaproteobacteria bacterium]
MERKFCGEGLLAGKSVVHGASGRYATALFSLAHDAAVLDQVETDLMGFGELLEQNAELFSFCVSSAIPFGKKSQTIQKIVTKAGGQELTVKFLGYVASRGRLGLIKNIIRDFARLMDAHRDEAVAEVTSAIALETEQSDALLATLKAALGRDVRIEAKVDPSLLGGMIVKVGSRLVDNSIANQLTQLQRNLKEAR